MPDQDSPEIQNLQELNDELENYFRNTIIPQLFVDADLILRKFTPPAMKQFKFTKDHIGKPMAELVDNIRYSTIMDNLREVIDTKEILEKEIQTTDMCWFQMNIIPYIVQKTGKPNGAIITFVDITNRIKDLRTLEKLNAAHETFIFSVSHDLKGPLSNLEGLIETLSDWHVTHNQETIRQMLEDSVKRMRTIINELSDITKIEGRFQETTEDIDLTELLREVELTIKDKITETQATLQHNIQVAHIHFSRKNLRSILYNLISNAIQYRSPGKKPEIAISITRDGDCVNLAVKDNGIGIAATDIENIFQKFTRVKRDLEGTGIGLYLVKKIVENNNGTITVSSQPNQGSEFVICLKQEEEK